MKRIRFYNGGVVTSPSVEIEIKDWFRLYLEYLESIGIDPRDCTFKMPDGELAFVAKEKNGVWHWEIE